MAFAIVLFFLIRRRRKSGVAETRVRVTPRVRVRGRVEGEVKGKGGGEDRVKALN